VKSIRSFQGPLLWICRLASVGLLALLVVPVASLFFQVGADDIYRALEHPAFLDALGLSLKTTSFSMIIIVGCGLPLAYWLGDLDSSFKNIMRSLIEFPVVLPPAVVGLSLLLALSPHGIAGGLLADLGSAIVFSQSAVVLAQVSVAAPFFILAAANAFSRVDPELLLVARTLGASPQAAFVRIALPLAYRGLFSAGALAWARAMGEFGATLLFAGNLPGKTQTLSLALYQTMESDVRVAVAIALCLVAIALFCLVPIRLFSSAARSPRL